MSTTLLNSDLIGSDEVQKCAEGLESEDSIEEAIPYMAGNTLWAFYQFTVVIATKKFTRVPIHILEKEFICLNLTTHILFGDLKPCITEYIIPNNVLFVL